MDEKYENMTQEEIFDGLKKGKFMGRPVKEWIEMDSEYLKAAPKAEALLKEVVRLRGKVSIYEDRIRGIWSFVESMREMERKVGINPKSKVIGKPIEESQKKGG